MEEKNKLRFLKLIFKALFIISIVLTIGMFWYDQWSFYFSDVDIYDFLGEEYEETAISCLEDSNVAVIRIYGDIVSYPMGTIELEDIDITPQEISSETIVDYINKINEDDEMEAIIVEIDSPGGYPVASEEIAKALRRSQKPTIAVIREQGVSGAYLVASAADKIYASRISDVGGIGITMSYLDYSQQNRREGIIYQELSSGKFKDTGDPDKELTAEEKELLMKDIEKVHQIFVEMVAENRNLEIEFVEKLADGSSMLGQDAQAVGLIDEIGDIEDVKKYLRDEFGIEPEFCIYQ